MTKQKKNKKKSSILLSLLGWGTLLLIILLVRHLLVQSYRISTSSMQEALYPGDYVLVNKLHMKDNPGRNRIILFQSPLLQDSLSRPLFVSRCIGMPGDTLEVTGDGYFINGEFLPHSPQALHEYAIEESFAERFSRIVSDLKLPRRNREIRDGVLYATLSSFEEYLIRDEIKEEESQLITRVIPETYRMIIPRKNLPYRLDSLNIHLSQNAILSESSGQVLFRDNKLYIEGKESAFFTFRQDYYWVLSDNSIDGVDSRHLGFISADYIVGNVWFCWYTKNREQLFKFIR